VNVRSTRSATTAEPISLPPAFVRSLVEAVEVWTLQRGAGAAGQRPGRREGQAA